MADALKPCGECGMPCVPTEYHPYAACLMFKACHNSDTVRGNLQAVRDDAAAPPAPTGQQAEPTDVLSIAKRVGFLAPGHPEGHRLGWLATTNTLQAFAEALLAGHQSERPAPAGQAVGMLTDVEALLREAYEHWDADREFKVGKILLALIGHNKGYDKRADAFRAALAASPAEGKGEAS